MSENTTSQSVLPLRTKLLFSTGDLSTSIPLAILMFFQLYFLTDVAGLRPDYAGWAVGLPRIWDAINYPLIGLISDRIRTRWGRRRVLLLFGSVPLGLTFLFMWLVPPLGQVGNNHSKHYRKIGLRSGQTFSMAAIEPALHIKLYWLTAVCVALRDARYWTTSMVTLSEQDPLWSTAPVSDQLLVF